LSEILEVLILFFVHINKHSETRSCITFLLHLVECIAEITEDWISFFLIYFSKKQ